MSQVGAWDFAGEKAVRTPAVEQQPGELTRGKALALLRRYTLLLGEGRWFGAGANREKGFLLPKGPALAFARFQLRAWEGERRAGAATMGLGAPIPANPAHFYKLGGPNYPRGRRIYQKAAVIVAVVQVYGGNFPVTVARKVARFYFAAPQHEGRPGPQGNQRVRGEQLLKFV